LQKTILKNNVEQVEKQKLGSKINLQKGWMHGKVAHLWSHSYFCKVLFV
jgi:hypothetical protein